ncbi:ABC transporter permease [Paenibacillus beijingensis]|uniref:Sugar ABC transporter permease n=1 Tax=Paenibacillus beijingensis TaxID=1126833 RepID=A0A0D5NNJ3_9BACL|nr:ABC transporter permease subunit [Paenibacillus beijingensis]AJY76841.1 sugar ABC transporter permease [Paenibacillus beijingensis]
MNVLKEIGKNRTLYLMAFPGLALFFLFNYLPMAGVVVAFKNYNFSSGLFGSPWAKPLLGNFEFFFSSDAFWRVTRNTLALNFSFIFFGTLLALAISILLNEVRFLKVKKAIQSGILLPYFISWIVVGVFAYALFNFDYGMVNKLLQLFGIPSVEWYNTYEAWPIIMTAISVWKTAGYTSIIFLAVLAGIDHTYYEAADIDGAGKWSKIRHITIPHLMPTATILTLLAIGRIMYADFGMFYAIVGENSILYPSADVIDTYVYRALRKLGDVGMSSAVGLYQSVIGFFLVLISNRVARKYQNEGSIF